MEAHEAEGVGPGEPRGDPDPGDYRPFAWWLIVTGACVAAGMYLGGRSGGYGDEWLGFILGGGIGGGLSYLWFSRTFPHFGHPGSGLRVATAFVIFGVPLYLAAQWLGHHGPFLLLALLGVVNFLYQTAKGLVRLVVGGPARWVEKPGPVIASGGVWDRELDQ